MGNTSANTDGTGVSVVNSKWMVRNICEDDESLLVLLPDFGRNASVPDHCKCSSSQLKWSREEREWLMFV